MVKWLRAAVTVMAGVVAEIVPSVTVIVCCPVVLSVKLENVWTPESPDVKVYLPDRVYGSVADPSVDWKYTCPL